MTIIDFEQAPAAARVELTTPTLATPPATNQPTNPQNPVTNYRGDEGRPYWQTRPCPVWCAYGHGTDTCVEDAEHMAGSMTEVVLSTEPGRHLPSPYATFIPPTVEAYLAQHELDRDPRVRLSVDTEHVRGEVRLTITEAQMLRDALSQFIATAENAEQH
ncbi:hypothetical protein F4561_002209 [Lipingzhangella halophila]|uniref:Uncharacterized protein n=1 Tax=Lipingzhangella halophila TaxID=1783352 RepID=A0A7W7RG63_9ACTN|nr:hypothetical protein [Lipingzhangella halophila]MBB4931389.1 hypothetical protein [Lipingzhangella halophila]